MQRITNEHYVNAGLLATVTIGNARHTGILEAQRGTSGAA